MRAIHWLSFAFLAVAVAAFARYFLARQESSALRSEISLLAQENRQIAELKAEHERLIAAKVSDAELARLRNDRAALVRLRAEINKLEEIAERKGRDVQEPGQRAVDHEARQATLEKEFKAREAALKAALEIQERRRAEKQARDDKEARAKDEREKAR